MSGAPRGWSLPPMWIGDSSPPERPVMAAVILLWAGFVVANAIILPRHYSPHVRVETAAPGKLLLQVRASGNLEAKDSTTIKAQFDGPILKRFFQEGDRVDKGKLLAVIGRERIQLDYESKRDGLKNAYSDLAHARKELRLEEALLKRGAVSSSSVEDAQRGLAKAEQALHSAQETFRQAQEMWDSSNVIAPLAGTVVKDWVGDDKSVTGGKEIVTIADVSEYTVRARVDELDFHQIKERMPADVRLAVYPDIVLPAEVLQLGSQPDGNGLPQIPIILRLTNLNGLRVRPKLSAEVRIHTGIISPTFSVPLSAIVNTDGEPRVWVVGALNRLRSQSVGLGKSNPERVQVTQGLAIGDRVCIEADPHFMNGMRVLIDDAPAKTGVPAAVEPPSPPVP